VRALTTALLGAFLFLQSSAAQQPLFRPGSRQAAQAENRNEVPPQVKPAGPRVDPAKLKSEADELAKRAQSIPGAIEHVTKGQLPSDLAQQLKEIEKLAKQLRRQIGQ